MRPYLVYVPLLLVAGAFAMVSGFAVRSKGSGNPLLAIAAAIACGIMVFVAARAWPAEKRPLKAGESSLFVGLLWIGAAIVTPVMKGAQPSAPRSQCLSNIKQLALCVIMYQADNDDRMPLTSNWRAEADKVAKRPEPFRCPESRAPHTYAYNAALAACRYDDLGKPESTVMLFEAAAQLSNASGGAEWLLLPHRDTGNVAFCDGHGKRVDETTARALRWNPFDSNSQKR